MQRTVQFINNDHPAAKAASITSEAMKRVYFEARAQAQAYRTTQKARMESLAALALSERIHNRVTESLKATSAAWIIREVAA